MKKILILPVSVGGGHFKVAQVLKKAFLRKSLDLEINIEDALARVSWPLRFLYKNIYSFFIDHWPLNHLYNYAYRKSKEDTPYTRIWHKFVIFCYLSLARGLKKFIWEYKPDLIICLHPFSLELISVWRKEGKIKCPLTTVVTDLAPHRLWAFSFVDQYYVATEEIKKLFLEIGISGNKIKVTGIPLDAEFYQDLDKKRIINELGLSEKRKTILVLCRRLKFRTLKRVLLNLFIPK